MTEINIFNDPRKVPKPRDQVKIEAIQATPYPDRYRVKVAIEVTAFLERPNLLIALRNAEGRVINELNVIETMHSDMEFTLHIRNVGDPAGAYVLDVELFYDTRNPPQDKESTTFTIPSGTSN